MRSAIEKLIGKARRNGRYVRNSIQPGPRVILDLAPDTLRLPLESVRLAYAPIHGFVRHDVTKAERLLVEALEKSRS